MSKTERPKIFFQNKLHSSADQNTFEFDSFFKLQNVVKSRIHFQYKLEGGLIFGGGGRL